MSLRKEGLLECKINEAKKEIEESQQIVLDDDGKVIPKYMVECFL